MPVILNTTKSKSSNTTLSVVNIFFTATDIIIIVDSNEIAITTSLDEAIIILLYPIFFDASIAVSSPSFLNMTYNTFDINCIIRGIKFATPTMNNIIANDNGANPNLLFIDITIIDTIIKIADIIVLLFLNLYLEFCVLKIKFFIGFLFVLSISFIVVITCSNTANTIPIIISPIRFWRLCNY